MTPSSAVRLMAARNWANSRLPAPNTAAATKIEHRSRVPPVESMRTDGEAPRCGPDPDHVAAAGSLARVQPPIPASEPGAAAWRAMLDRPQDTALAFDYDGVLAPIVADPDAARPYPGMVAALGRLAAAVGSLSIISGREVATILRLAGLDDLLARENVTIHGLYGMQRWDSAARAVVADGAAPGVALARAELPALLERLHVHRGVAIEDKGLSVAVHTRRADDPHAWFATLVRPLTELADRHGLALEPGRLVLELRPPGTNKGTTLTGIVRRRGARAVAYFGDDLGDLAAFDAVDELRGAGLAGLKVCSGSDEVEALAARADVVVDGPPGVFGLLAALLDALDHR
jgi:trehalose 6-phosphate phosphatase